MAPDTISNQSPAFQHAATQGPIQQIRIDLGSPTIAIVVSLLIVIGAAALALGLNLAKQYQQDLAFRDLQVQYKLVERRMMDVEAYAILNGWKLPGDEEWGPTGNLKRMVPK